VWESFGDVGFQRLRKCGEREKIKIKTSIKYNGSLTLAMLERANIMTNHMLKVNENKPHTSQNNFASNGINLLPMSVSIKFITP